ncbi:MAG TPA: pitrilysin family protein [Gemmatimonadales bacterium]|jgi:predicted Zn-dependent peptidase
MMRHRLILAATLVVAAASAAAAQVTTAPTLGAAPTLHLPPVEHAVLPNGITLLVSRNAEVPIVEGRLLIDGGARVAGAPSGLPTFAAGALMEGAGGLTGVRLAEEIDLLGASIRAGTSWEAFTISVRAPKRTIDKAMALMADVALHPNFAAADVNRLRGLRLAALSAARDRPSTVASRVFMRNVFPAGLPYHNDIGGDSASVVHFDSTAVRNLWERVIDPRRATLIITGDVTLAEAQAWAMAHFGQWRSPAQPIFHAAAGTVAAAPRTATRVILVDKPDAAQSVILIGAPGVSRNAPDYPAIELMNTILGGSFSSRLNDLLREQLGYTYGASSNFSWSPVPGPFIAQAAVRTNVTDSSLALFMREFRRIRDSAVTPVELQRGKNYVVLGALGDYETAGQVAGAIASSVIFHRPLATIPPEFARINQLTAAAVQHAAMTWIDPSRLTIVVVGDLAKIRSGIEKLHLGPIETQVY